MIGSEALRFVRRVPVWRLTPVVSETRTEEGSLGRRKGLRPESFDLVLSLGVREQRQGRELLRRGVRFDRSLQALAASLKG